MSKPACFSSRLDLLSSCGALYDDAVIIPTLTSKAPKRAPVWLHVNAAGSLLYAVMHASGTDDSRHRQLRITVQRRLTPH